MTKRLVIVALLALAALPALADNVTTVDGAPCPNSTTKTVCMADPGATYLWTETTTDASGTICFRSSWRVVNTGTTDFDVYEATQAGVQLHSTWGPVRAGGSCKPGTPDPDDPDEEVQTCGTYQDDIPTCVQLVPLETGASAEFRSAVLK